MWQNLVFSKNKSLTDLIVNLYIAFIVMCVWLLHSSYNMLFLLKEELFPRTYIKTSNLNDYLNHFPPQGPFSLFLVSFSYRIWYCVLSLYFLCLNIFWKQRKAVIFCGPFLQHSWIMNRILLHPTRHIFLFSTHTLPSMF